MRKLPNVIITGTPGVGKSSHCELLAQKTGLRHISINEVVKQQECHEGWNNEFSSWIVDEDKLLDVLEVEVKHGGCVLDWHACDLFPRSWIDLVVVLRVDSSTLYDRLKARNYSDQKLQENLDAEIMEVLIQEARDSYDDEIVVELRSDTAEEMDQNIARMETWLERWKGDNSDVRDRSDSRQPDATST